MGDKEMANEDLGDEGLVGENPPFGCKENTEERKKERKKQKQKGGGGEGDER